MPHASTARRPLILASSLLAAASLVLAGCVAPKEQTTPDPAGPDAPTATAPASLEELYEQELEWWECGANECATLRAPLDWEDPERGEISIAVARSTSTGSAEDRVGALLVNPGGPGASGIGSLDYFVSSFSERLTEAYDVVAFDPRGVGDSSAVRCGDDADLDEFLLADLPFETQEDLEAAREVARAFGETCLESTGELLAHVDTGSAARDMDLLRAALGEEQLHYAGFSYGTFLGATYAGLFPERVGRFLLDGALDPAMSELDLVVGQAAGFEEALTAYVADCQAGRGCPLTGGVEEGKQQIARLVDRVERRPLETDYGTDLTSALLFYGIVVTLYNDDYWYLLTGALQEAIRDDDGTTFLDLANAYLERTVDGQYLSNQMVAFTAINCVDYPAQERDMAELTALAAEVEEVAPTFGADFVLGVGCETWPVPAVGERGPITAPGAPPILVVGTTGDPATPYEWSVAMAEQLESGVLVTWEGEGHTAYGRANACLTDAVDDYLVDGVVPEPGLVC